MESIIALLLSSNPKNPSNEHEHDLERARKQLPKRWQPSVRARNFLEIAGVSGPGCPGIFPAETFFAMLLAVLGLYLAY
jgi:hypothetical protein